MTHLKGRLARLERRVEAASVCPACKNEGYPSTTLRFAGEPPPMPRGCHLCGRHRPGLAIVVELPPEALA